MAKAIARFDTSLKWLVEILADCLGESVLAQGTILRDAKGILTFFAAAKLDPEKKQHAAVRLDNSLGAYARKDRLLVEPEDFGWELVQQDPSTLKVWIDLEQTRYLIRLLDRRIVGADWLHPNLPLAPPPPRFVFASLKGGVGRSTALSVTAAQLARLGKRVLAVDLDLEAPGLGAMLLTEDLLPEFGMLDVLVENGMGGLDDEGRYVGLDEGFYADLVAPSALAPQGGKIDVIPAIGKSCLRNPADVLAKIARAYVEDLRPDGSLATLLDQIREVIDHFAEPSRYDVILIDARAGLHESSAAAFLGIGAEIFLFGLDEPQTFQGFKFLFAHLARLQQGEQPYEWAERLTVVQGKAPVDTEEREEFTSRIKELLQEVALMKGPGTCPSPRIAEPGELAWDDSLDDADVLPGEWALPEPLAVLGDARFEHFNPTRRRDLLSEALYRQTFGELLERIESSLPATEKK